VINLTILDSSSNYHIATDDLRKAGEAWLLCVGLNGCVACSALLSALSGLSKLAGSSQLSEVPSVFWVEVCEIQDVLNLQLNITFFPTLIGFRGADAICGWEGFSTMQPSEITVAVLLAALDEFQEMLS
jgi:hypothetical protein